MAILFFFFVFGMIVLPLFGFIVLAGVVAAVISALNEGRDTADLETNHQPGVPTI